MTRRINVILPEQTLSILDRVTTKGNRSRFISKAVHYFVENQGEKSLHDQLKAGYLANSQRNLEMAADWFALEEEAHKTLERSTGSKSATRTKKGA